MNKFLRLLILATFVGISTLKLFAQANFWQPVTSLPTSSAQVLYADSLGLLYAGTYDKGAFRSSDAGTSWEAINNGLGGNPVFAFATARNGDLLVTTTWGLYRSTNHGDTWSPVSSVSPMNGYCIAADTSGRIFIGAEQDFNVGIIWYSSDDGATWSDSRLPMNPDIFSLVISSPSAVHAGTAGGVFLTTNSGAAWDSLNNGLSTRAIWVFTVSRTGDYFVGTWLGGIWRSTDLGANWLQSGLPGSDVRSMVVNQKNHIFAVAFGSGVHRSTDNGLTWSNVSSGLTNTALWTIALDQNGYLFTASDSGRVFRSVYSTTEVGQPQKSLPVAFALFQNYPNPFNPVSNIGFSIAESRYVTLKVYDMLGREVAVLLNERKEARVHEVKFDASGLASGVYLYRMQAGSFIATKKLLLLR